MLYVIKKHWQPCWLVFAVSLLLLNNVWATTVDGVRLWRAPDHTRIVLDMSGPIKHKVFQLDDPARLVVDIASVTNRATFNSLAFAKTPIKQIRTAVRQQENLRLVFDLRRSVKPRSFLLRPNKGKPHRLVIDLYDKQVVTNKTLDNIRQTRNKRPLTAVLDSGVKGAAGRDIIVVVDAGHGGEDPGAIGPQGTQEKVVVLDIAKKLARLINASKGYRAILTRTGDYFIALRRRRDIARQQRADLFVSIHADAFKNPRAKGASVYALSRRGATSETARFLAARDNEADLIGGVGAVKLDDKDKVLRGVLVDLSMTATVGASLDVGKHVLNDMGRFAHLHKKNVEQAGFLVLKSPDVPSILVETGFISNPAEAKRLATSAYRQKMAKSIFKGIHDYFSRRPPPGTYVARKKHSGGQTSSSTSRQQVGHTTKPIGLPSPRRSGATAGLTHTVVSGDSLSTIAQRYRVSMAKIKQLNNLTSDTLYVGRVLKISAKKIVKPNYAAIYEIVDGDTLSAIALRYNTSVNAIRRINKMSALSIIYIGQKIKIPHEK